MLFSYYWGKLLLHWKRTEPRWFLNCCSDNNPMCYYRVTVVWLTCFCTCASCSHKAAMRCLLGTVHWIGATHTCPGLTNIVQYKDEHTHTQIYTQRQRNRDANTHADYKFTNEKKTYQLFKIRCHMIHNMAKVCKTHDYHTHMWAFSNSASSLYCLECLCIAVASKFPFTGTKGPEPVPARHCPSTQSEGHELMCCIPTLLLILRTTRYVRLLWRKKYTLLSV